MGAIFIRNHPPSILFYIILIFKPWNILDSIFFFSKYKLNLKLKKLSKQRWQPAVLSHEVWKWALMMPGKAGAEVKYEKEGVKAELSRTTVWPKGRAPGQREDTTRVQGKGYDPTFISRQTVTLTGRDEKPRAKRPTEKLIQQTRPDAIQQPGPWEKWWN